MSDVRPFRGLRPFDERSGGEFFDREDLAPEIAALRGECLAVTYLTCAHIAHREGKVGERLAFLVQALASDWRTFGRRLTHREPRVRDTTL